MNMEKHLRFTIRLRTYNRKYLPKQRMFYHYHTNPNPTKNLDTSHNPPKTLTHSQTLTLEAHYGEIP